MATTATARTAGILVVGAAASGASTCSCKSKCSRSRCVFFRLYLLRSSCCRPECLDQWHMDEEVAWVAVEAGAWLNNAGDGGFQAGTTPAQGAVWESVRFHANSGRDHAVLTHVQTTHDPHFVKSKIVILSRFAALSVSQTLTASPLQPVSRA